MNLLRTDLKEACSYNILLMGELERNPGNLLCPEIIDKFKNQSTQVDLVNIDLLTTRIEEL